jgi:hypothetical protein
MLPAIQQTKPVKLGRWGEQEEAVQRPQFQVWNQELERSTYGGESLSQEYHLHCNSDAIAAYWLIIMLRTD